MNEFIKNQLSQIEGIDKELLETSDDITIKKYIKTDDNYTFNVGEWYMLEFKDYIVNPYPGFNLHQNWNKGVIPKYAKMYCQICQDLGKMIRVSAWGIEDTTYNWVGWVPKVSVKIIN